jgi:hypothetical protein
VKLSPSLAVLVLAGALAGCGTTRIVNTRVIVPGPTTTVTVTAHPRVRTVTVTPRPAASQAALPPGVTAVAGGYMVDCMVAQCTTEPNAGPFGLTCDIPKGDSQFCPS